jgi:uncharacterized protein involved in exopolysaccharide biosynthesis/Mrp family chromosome partitioning ATPase
MRHASISEALSGLESAGKIWRHRRVFAGVFLGTISIAILALLVLPVRYLATASVIVAEQEPGVVNMSPAWAQKIGDPADLESQLLVIRSPRLMRLVMNAPGVLDAVVQECERGRFLGSSSPCERLKSDSTAFIEYVDSRFNVASAGRSRVINISYQSSSPAVAQTLANALTTAFLEDQRTEGANSREVATTWLWQELRQLDDQLRQADDKIQKFRRTKGLMRGANAPITSERLTSIGQQLSVAEAARAEAAARLQEIKSEQARGLTDAPSVLSSRTVADLKQQLTTVSAQLASAAGVLGPKHPSILALSREQALIQQRLADEMENIAASAQKAYDANNSLVNSLKKQMETVKAEAGSATLDEASIESMVRDTEIKRQQYAELYKKASELETERRVLQGSTRLVSLAELPNKPFFPKKIPFLAAGSTLALILGIAAALLADRLAARPAGAEAPAAPQAPKPAVATEAVQVVAAPATAPVEPSEQVPDVPSTPSERKSLLSMMAGVPILARLPRLKEPRQASVVSEILQSHLSLSVPRVLWLAADDDEFQRVLHQLKPHLGIGNGRRARRIVVTSPETGDGKTVTTLALAEHLAASGCRVLAVECDMLNPGFEQALGLEGGVGLLGVLAGSMTARDAVVRTAHPNLDALVAGAGSAKAADLLFGRKLAGLLADVGDYDAVLIDSPPPSGGSGYFAGIDHVMVCMRGNALLIGRAASAIAGVKALGAESIAIAVTMEETHHATARRPSLIPTEAYARAG